VEPMLTQRGQASPSAEKGKERLGSDPRKAPGG